MDDSFWSPANKENIPPPHTPISSTRRQVPDDNDFTQTEPLAGSTPPPSTPLVAHTLQKSTTELDLNEVGRRLGNIKPLRSVRRDINVGLESTRESNKYVSFPTKDPRSLGTKALLGSLKTPRTHAVQSEEDWYNNNPRLPAAKHPIGAVGSKAEGKQKVQVEKDVIGRINSLQSKLQNTSEGHKENSETEDDTDYENKHTNSTTKSSQSISGKTRFQPSTKLTKHLRLDDGTERANHAVEWLENEEELIFNQICLMPARANDTNAERAVECFIDLRPRVLELLATCQFKNHGYALLFSGYTYFSVRREGKHGYCLYLLCEYPEPNMLANAIEKLAAEHLFKRYLDIIVHQGKPKLYGRHGINLNTNENSDSILRADLFGSGQSKPTQLYTTLKKETVKGKHSNKIDNTLTPEHTPPEIIATSLPTEAQINRGWHGFHYGLHWITNLPILSNEDGCLSKYTRCPDIGSSIGRADDNYGCGTLGGYLVDDKGRHYILSAYHVFNHLVDLHKPHPTGTQNGRWVVAPAQTDMIGQHRALVKKRDALAGDLLRAVKHMDRQSYDRIVEEGMKTVKELETCTELKDSDGLAFGQIVASSWKTTGVGDLGTRHLVDMTLIRPLQSRLGSNTFTYYGRDKPFGAEYRVEARGWSTPKVGQSVLKVGRTTGLTKGTIISTAADLKICIGLNEAKAVEDPALKTNYYVQVQAHVATAGSSPWFSEAGDSGAFILKAPSIARMHEFQYSKGEKAIPTQAPVVGLLFGGADSVEGVHLTFFNSSSFIQSQIHRLTNGLKLIPGLYHDESDSNIKLGLRAAHKAWDSSHDDDGLSEDEAQECDTPEDHPFKKKVNFDDMVSRIRWADKLLKKKRVEDEDSMREGHKFTPTKEHVKTPIPKPSPKPRPRVPSVKFSPPVMGHATSAPSKLNSKRFTYQRTTNNTPPVFQTPQPERQRQQAPSVIFRAPVPQTAPVKRNVVPFIIDNDDKKMTGSLVRRQSNPKSSVEITPGNSGPRRQVKQRSYAHEKEKHEYDDHHVDSSDDNDKIDE